MGSAYWTGKALSGGGLAGEGGGGLFGNWCVVDAGVVWGVAGGGVGRLHW